MFVPPREAAKKYKVQAQTLRKWAKEGKIQYIITEGKHRRYRIDDNTGRSIIYARVSSEKQPDLDNQVQYLKNAYPGHELVTDIGSGINFNRKGLQKVLELLFKRDIKEVVVASKDRLSRFGFELFENIFRYFGAKITVLSTEYNSPEQELAEDLLAITTVFTAKYHGRRSYSKKSKDLSE